MYMNEIVVRYIALPATVRGFTARDPNGDYNIYINDSIGIIQQAETYKHELKHINEDNFGEHDVDLIEGRAHRK